ncbi:transferase hexapeptide repeat [Methanospirillum hungatei JF-1]|uniref:Transferase hexapeptide repeat n=1 Tax=Methanospirillum hungatei JF-1 (strain ATCC 27890 / DSM 864 / NBRC 100397 / JF-1) TaxID=323259 RepID=Q2FN96_METHJ|nr:acetyltransferase [Methanospirillum hungatei]ABD41832.1 transferase hexapeptide repeat [Methanospirillum hungatei JF-1]
MTNDTLDDLLIFGCGGHARNVIDIALSSGWKNIIIIDENGLDGEKIYGFPIIQDLSTINPKFQRFIVAFGDNKKRKIMFEWLIEKHFQPINLISPNSYISQNAKLGIGIVIGHQSYIGPSVHISDNVIINTKAIIEHECKIGYHTHIAIGAIVAGKCIIGDLCFIGAGTVIRDNLEISSLITTGAGAVVTKNLEDPGIYIGIPAKVRLNH